MTNPAAPQHAGGRAARVLALLSLAALALALSACQRKLTFEERFHSASLADAPGQKLAQCMLAKLKPTAAFRIGQQAARENREMPKLAVQPADRGKLRVDGPDMELLLDDAGEALAVACGIEREAWRRRTPYDIEDRPDNPVTELGIQDMTYGVAMSHFQAGIAASPAFARGVETVQQERAALAARQQHSRQVSEQAEYDRMRDFAVAPQPQQPPRSEPLDSSPGQRP